MHGSRDSSVWRTLAVAFGDGLAFGVGLTLTNSATRAAATKTQAAAPDIRRISDRLNEIEERIERPRPVGSLPMTAVNGATVAKVAEAVLTAMDGRFGEIGEQIERRLAELEDRIRHELESLATRGDARAEDLAGSTGTRLEALRAELTTALEAQRVRADSDVRVLRGQMMEVHKQFAGTLARLVDEQIEHTISTRLQAIQEQLREAVREELAGTQANAMRSTEALLDARLEAQGSSHDNAVRNLEALLEKRLEMFREERSGSDRQTAELQARLEAQERAQADAGRNLEALLAARLEAFRQEQSGSERAMAELMSALGKSCLQAAERMAPGTAVLNGSGGGGGETHVSAAPLCEIPAFARQVAPRRHWQVPFVSCFLMATTGLLALHYLVV